MKKVLSFVLVLAMILGCTSMAFAATETKVAKGPFADAPTSAVATILKDMGVLFGDENGDVLLDKTISRAEFCAIVLRALGLESVAKGKAQTKFTDVPYDAWYSGYVATALSKKLVDGKSATEFDPEGTVTADEALAFVVKGLGYEQAHLEGAWPMNYRLAAKDLGILPADYDFDDAQIKRADVFEVLYKALYKTLVEWNAKTETWVNQGIGSTTMASRLGVTATYSDTDAQKITRPNVSELKTNTGFDGSEFLGKFAEIVTKNGKIIGFGDVLSTTLVGKTDTTGTTFTAIDGTDYTYPADQETNAVLTRNNDKANTLVIEKAVTATLEVGLDADNKIATLYGVSVWNKNATVQITTKAAAALADGKFTDASILSQFILNASGSGVVVEGAVEDLKSIEADDIVEVYRLGGKVGAEAAKLVVTRNVVEGTVTKYNKKADAYTVNGTAYTFADDKLGSDLTEDNVNAAIKGATEFAFYLNSEDEIVKCEFVTEPKAEYEYRYAIVLDATTTLEQTLEGKTIKSTSNDAIRLLPLDTLEEEKYEYVSAGSIGNDEILKAADGWKPTVASKEIIKFAVKDDELIKILTQEAFKVLTEAAFNKNGFVGTPSGLFASDVTIVVGGVADKESTQAAYYAEKTVADLNKTTGTGFYLLNEAGKVETVVLQGYNVAAPAPSVVSAVAFTFVGSDGDDYAEFITFEGEEDSLYISGASVVTEGSINTYLYKITLAGEKIAQIDVADGFDELKTVAGIKYEDGVLTTDVDADTALCLDPVFFKWNKDDKVLELVDYAADIFDKATCVDTYKINSEYVDAIVIH